MITFNTLNSIVDDIMLEIRNSNISDSESLSRFQIEQWIIQYRSLLLKQDIDKGKDINPDYVQEMLSVELIKEDLSLNPKTTTGEFRFKTKIKIPRGIDFNYKTGILAITDVYGSLIQLVSEVRSSFNSYRRYVKDDYMAYKRGEYLYLIGPGELKYINIKGIFENPNDLMVNPTGDELYPIPANMVHTLKELIITKEIEITAVADKTNDGTNNLEAVSLSRNDEKRISKGVK